MPLTLVERLPMPNLKVYSAGSVVLLSVAVYHALNITSDPDWQLNATLQQQEEVELTKGSQDDLNTAEQPLLPSLVLDVNGTRNITEQALDVITYMMQEPLCMWTLINMAYCSLAVFASIIQKLVFGKLRAAEAQRVKDKLWNYVFYKFIFVFGVINVQYMDEMLAWCSWFTALGFLHLLGQLCKDRFEYLTSMASAEAAAYRRLAALAGSVLLAGVALLALAVTRQAPLHTRAFMAAECVVVIACELQVLARLMLRNHDADAPLYYTRLVLDSVSLCVEAGDVAHMVAHGRAALSLASLVLLLQLRQLLQALHATACKHLRRASTARRLASSYPMASKQEMEKNQDKCAICWEPMKEARKLPCDHLFHNGCLWQWVQQDASCPTCRRTLADPASSPAPSPPPAPPSVPTHAHALLLHGSRWWWASLAPHSPAQLHAMAAQVQAMFPQFSIQTLMADLLTSHSSEQTIDNILAGRVTPTLPPDAMESDSSSTTVPEPRVSPTVEPQDLTPPPVCFSRVASEREALLLRRKEILIASARQKYLDRLQNNPAQS